MTKKKSGGKKSETDYKKDVKKALEKMKEDNKQKQQKEFRDEP